MKPREPLIASLVIISMLNFTRADDDDTHHHRVIIHVPYKVHTIHHTILKHVHHHDKGNDDKYEVLGYTVGKPIDPLGHHFEHHEPQLMHPYHPPHSPPPPPQAQHVQPYHHHYPEAAHHEFGGSNELGHGSEQEWTPSYGHHHDFAGGGHPDAGYHYEPYHQPITSHDYPGHEPYAGYD